MLHALPIQVEHVDSVGKAAIQLGQVNYDVILTESLLPDGGWMDVLHLVRECPHEPEVIVTDPQADARFWAEALNLGATDFLSANRSWGFGLSVITQRDDVSAVPGRFGWEGGLGTSWASDPKEELVGILMTQMSWSSPSGPRIWNDFWISAYAAIYD